MSAPYSYVVGRNDHKMHRYVCVHRWPCSYARAPGTRTGHTDWHFAGTCQAVAMATGERQSYIHGGYEIRQCMSCRPFPALGRVLRASSR